MKSAKNKMFYYSSSEKSILRKVAEDSLQLLFPMATYCLCCGKYIDDARSYCICDHCIRHIGWGHITIDLAREAQVMGRPQILDSARACMKYGLYERRLIFDLKYNGLTYVARAIARIMADRIMSDEAAWPDMRQTDYIAAVPVHRDKLAVRGFNQAEKIARHLSSFLRISHLPECIERNKATAAQRALSGSERFMNLEGVFSVNPSLNGRIQGKRLLLIDDVYTSGSTAWHCSMTLKGAGACTVDFLSLATSNDFATGYFSLEKNQNKV